MKKGVIAPIIITILFLVNFVSAYGSYSDFSFGGILDSIDSSTMILGTLFIIIFTILFYALSRVFKTSCGAPNTTIAAVISLALSLLIIYGINSQGINLDNIFSGIGISGDFLAILAPIIILGGIILIVWKLGLRGLFLILGIVFILVAVLTDWVYSKGSVLILGIIFLLIGLWLLRRHKKKLAGTPGQNGRFWNNVGTGAGAGLMHAGKGIGYGAKGIGKGVAWAGKAAWKAAHKKQQQAQQQVQQQQVQKRQRTQQELQQKYDYYKDYAKNICRQIGHIPAKGTPEYHRWKQATKAVKIIEETARKNNVRLN